MSSHFNNAPIYFLDLNDFNSDGTFKYDQNNKPMVIMVMGDFCGYCKRAAPMYKEFAEENPHVISAVIRSDGDKLERQLYNMISEKVVNIPGVPTFLKYKNGKFITTHNGPRTKGSLIEFSTN